MDPNTLKSITNEELSQDVNNFLKEFYKDFNGTFNNSSVCPGITHKSVYLKKE